MRAEERDPDLESVTHVRTTRILTMSLLSPLDKVEKLQKALHVKAKTESSYRFYSLWDKVYRRDVLELAYGRCFNNKGVPGVDGESFADIEKQGRDRWIGKLQEELRAKQYRPQPLLRVWIPKTNGGQRP